MPNWATADTQDSASKLDDNHASSLYKGHAGSIYFTFVASKQEGCWGDSHAGLRASLSA